MSEHRILIVDDDERVLFVLRRALLAFQNGYKIGITTPDSRQALNKAKEIPFDLLITDLKMPGVDEISTCAGDQRLEFRHGRRLDHSLWLRPGER